MSDELAAAFRRSEALANEKIDRGHWTPEQWSDDAERIMGHIDGCASALLNGHVDGLLRTIRALRENAKPRQITTVEELDALPVGSVVLVRGRAWTRFTPKQIHGGYVEIHKWMCPDGGILRADSDQDIILPATVLWEPLP